MKIICDRAMTESESLGVSVECENPRYDVMLNDIIADKGTDFVLNAIKKDDIRMYLDADDLEDKNNFSDMAFDVEVNRCFKAVKVLGYEYYGAPSPLGFSITINMPFSAKIEAAFGKTQSKELNDFCVFLEGGLK